MRRAERDSGFFVAMGTDCAGLHFVVNGRGGLPVSAKDGGTFGFTEFATFGFVFELLVMKEQLLTSGEHKIVPTIHAG